MRINKEIRQLSREMLRTSFTDGELDRGKIASLVQSLVTKRPRHFMDILQYYKRLLRLEIEKRHARIESAVQLAPQAAFDIGARLKRKYGGSIEAVLHHLDESTERLDAIETAEFREADLVLAF